MPKFIGYIFKSNDIKSLEGKLLQVINSSDQELIMMAENSHKIGQTLTPQMSAARFLSILD